MWRVLGVSAVFVVVAVVPVAAQVNRCAECHFAHFAQVPASDELARWGRSAHARHGVGCSSCHGGDPTTYHAVDAHRGMLDSRHSLSSVNRANVALTCASCHASVVASFRASAHAAAPDRDGAPVCTTCHGRMGAEIPSPARAEVACRGCHAGDPARADYGALARARVDALLGLERTLAELETAIGSVDDQQRRRRLAAELLLARNALRAAAESFHTFDFRVMDSQRARAQRRASELVAALVGTE